MAGALFAWGRGLLSASNLTANGLDRAGHVMRAAVLGVPRGQMLVTNTVTHTADEARAVARHLQERLSATAQAPRILVTSALHLRRSHVLWARAGFQAVPFPVDCRVAAGRAGTILDLLPTAGSLSKTETALREWYGWLFYQLVRR